MTVTVPSNTTNNPISHLVSVYIPIFFIMFVHRNSIIHHNVPGQRVSSHRLAVNLCCFSPRADHEVLSSKKLSFPGLEAPLVISQ